MKKPDVRRMRAEALPWSIAEINAPLALFPHSGDVKTIAQGGNLATHNPSCVAQWQPEPSRCHF